MKLKFLKALLLLIALIYKVQVWAQCAMCTATAENSIEEGSTAAKGINNGILYLFVMVFLFPIIFFFIYKNRKKFLEKFDEN